MNAPESISCALETDMAALTSLVNSAYRGEVSRKGWTTEADFLGGTRIGEEALKTIFNGPGSVILKYTNASRELLGCVHLQKEGAFLFLGMLAVRPEAQAAGIGRDLLNASEKYAASVRCHTIRITVITLRDELIAWYKRRGFMETGETKPFPERPEFGIPNRNLFFTVMEKKLSHDR